MKKTAIITATCILLFSTLFFYLIFSWQYNSWPSLGKERDAAFSDARYVLSFGKQGPGPAGDGTILPIYEMRSDGTSLRFVENVNTAKWQEASTSIQRSMGGYVGDITSPDTTKSLVIQQSLFSKPRVSILENGEQKNIFRGYFSEMVWLPDNRRIAVKDDKAVWIVDTETGSSQRILSGEIVKGAAYFSVLKAP